MKARLVDEIRAPGGQPGDIEYREYPADDERPIAEPAGFAYLCPGCGQEDWLDIHVTQGWTWNGDKERPTLRPSILHRPCKWHGYLTDGEFAPC